MAEPLEPSLDLAQLIGEVERLRGLVAAHAGVSLPGSDGAGVASREPVSTSPPRTGLERLVAGFDLSAFERDVVLLCAACELDAPFAALCRRAAVDPGRPRPTVGLLMACLPGANWAALAPDAPLRQYQLIRVSGERGIADAEVTIDEPVLHYLLGSPFWDPALDLLAEPLEPRPGAAASLVEVVMRIAETWSHPDLDGLPWIQLVGPDPRAGLEVVAGLAELLRANVIRIDAALLPSSAQELQAKLLAWQRFQRLEGAICVLDAASQSPDRTVPGDSLAAWLEAGDEPCVLLGRARRAPGARNSVTFELEPMSSREQAQLWATELAAAFRDVETEGVQLGAGEIEAAIEQLVGAFSLTTGRVRSACADARGRMVAEHAQGKPRRPLAAVAWQACRFQARPDLDAFAQRLQGGSSFADLCVDARTLSTLKKICDQVRFQGVVHERWGVGGKTRRGMSVTALFSGASGTGKTLAAEVIGNELNLDVYRVDLSATVSKYIGETEKNLGRIFDAAEGSGVILLFDEADALFGKRTEVKDSHDRHANLEIGYLLQRLEAYHGLAILTTNLRDDLDQAFLRRLRFIVEFPHPSAQERLKLWKATLSGGLPVTGVDVELLAALPLTGGQIRNVVLNAAFSAAAAQQAVDADILREAIVHELEKHGQRLGQGELLRLGPAGDTPRGAR